MEPNHAPRSEVTIVLTEALSIAESISDMIHLQDQSTVMGQVTLNASSRKPPDQLPAWKEPVMEWNAEGSVDCPQQSDEAVLEQYQTDRKMQWQKLYSQVDLQATQDMRRWMETVHKVGQYTRTSVTIQGSPEGNVFTMIWTILAMLVDFNWQKQAAAA